MKNEIPRRVRLDLNTVAEFAIFKAMQEVEKVGADERLTEAVILLGKARNHVADFVDNIPFESRLSQLCSVKNSWDKLMHYPDLEYKTGEKVKVLIENSYLDKRPTRYEIYEGVIEEYLEHIPGMRGEHYMINVNGKYGRYYRWQMERIESLEA